jgi:transcriptional regulator with XRE-family HTH domain
VTTVSVESYDAGHHRSAGTPTRSGDHRLRADERDTQVSEDDINDLLAAARGRLSSPSGSAAPMSRQELAEAVNAYLWMRYKQIERVDATYVGHLEQGRHRWPSARRREALREVLQVRTDAELGFFCRPRGPVPRGQDPAVRAEARDRRGRPTTLVSDPPQSAETPWHVPGALLDTVAAEVADESTVGGDPLSGDDLAAAHIRRRSLLLGMATITTAAGLLGPEGGSRRRIGATDVARLTALTSLYRSMDYEFGGGALAADVGRFAESASGLLDHSVSDALRPRLLTAVANARYLAGWTAFDATQHTDAQRHFIAAERYAIESADRRLLARIRYGQAKQLQHLRHNRDALQTLQLAHNQLQPTPGVLAILRGAEAASRGALGDFDAARRALGQSSEAFAAIEPDNEPDWMGFLDKGELLAQ